MNIVVCVKQVPDTWAEKRLDPSDNTLDRASADGVLNELDEYAIEEALRLKEADASGASTVTALTMGPDTAVDTVKKALQMGADAAVHVSDPALHGACAVQTAQVLAKALGTLQWDLVVLGSESTDARTSVVPAMLAEIAGVPQLTMARKVTVDGSAVTHRAPDRVRLRQGRGEPAGGRVRGREDQRAALPVLQGDHGGEEEAADHAVRRRPRRGRRGRPPRSTPSSNRPPRSGGTIVKDEGDGGVKLAEFLAAQKII